MPVYESNLNTERQSETDKSASEAAREWISNSPQAQSEIQEKFESLQLLYGD